MHVNVDLSQLKGFNDLDDIINDALNKCSLIFEAKAKQNLYGYGDLGDHGEVARSIYTEVDRNTLITAVGAEAGFWTEYGTGSYAEHGDGRPGYWVYVDDEYPGHQKAVIRRILTEKQAYKVRRILIESGIPESYVHVSNGKPSRPFLRPALHSEKEAFKAALAKEIKKGIIENGRRQ